LYRKSEDALKCSFLLYIQRGWLSINFTISAIAIISSHPAQDQLKHSQNYAHNRFMLILYANQILYQMIRRSVNTINSGS